MSEMRRLLMAQQGDNPWEKLDYLTIVPLDGDITVSIFNAYAAYSIYDEEAGEQWEEYDYCPFEYSLDDGVSWKRVYGNDGYANDINVGKNQTLKLRSEMDDFFEGTDDKIYSGSMSIYVASSIKTFAVAGTPMSLLDRLLARALLVDLSKTHLTSCFFNLFYNNTRGLIKILNPKTFLPATTVGKGSYGAMFMNCTQLLNAPELPAEKLGSSCYSQMFEGCTSLIKAPDLPSSIAYQSSYNRMFYGCKSLIKAPKISATTAVNSCCEMMFEGCTSLVEVPELSIKTLTSRCCRRMFFGCSSLIYIKAMFTTAPSSSYTQDWVYGVASTGTFVKNKNATWTNTFGSSAIPTGWTVITE